MPLTVVDSNSLEQKLALGRSPEALLITDASQPEQVPAAFRHAADSLSCRFAISPEILRGSKSLEGNGSGSIVWLDGESLQQGTPESIRRNLRHPGRSTFLITHFPGITSLDLLAIQPRFFGTGKQKEEAVDFTVRIACAGASLRTAPEILKGMREPWAQLALALYEDQIREGAALAPLDRLRRDEKLSPILDSLILRNLAILQMRAGRLQEALKLLKQGRRAYPAYAELKYIEAILAAQNGDGKLAVTLLESATTHPGGVFVGSGGESGYRAHWLVGTIAEMVGSQTASCNRFYTGVCARPPFEPSVVGLLRQRLPAEVVDSMQWELCRVVRGDVRYLEPVFYFLLLHRAFSAARRLLDTLELSATQRAELSAKFDSVFCCYQKRPQNRSGPTGVVLTGPFFVHSSIARINTEIAADLLARDEFSVGLEPHGFAQIAPRLDSRCDTLQRGLYHRPPYLDLTIRHHWPHDFSRPSAGKLAVIVPWEFGAIPRAWVQQIKTNVDELWVPSEFVKDVFVLCGIHPERIAVVPNGVNTNSFHPDGPAWRPPEARGFTFLFVGGAIARKGVDLLLKAYLRSFSPKDDVTLIIKDLGSGSFYRHMTMVPWLRNESKKPENPRLLVLLDEFDETKLAELYRGCDALVLPYRGEGFGMPLLEAMACGKPVITTAEGPAAEFCPPEFSYLIPAKNVPIPGGITGFGALAGEPTWFEPDIDELARAMREVYEKREEAARRGALAGERIRPAYNWPRVTKMYMDRILALAERPLSLAAPALHSSD
jgi:glycosyltransferase involved in cell wall biosynthesis